MRMNFNNVKIAWLNLQKGYLVTFEDGRSILINFEPEVFTDPVVYEPVVGGFGDTTHLDFTENERDEVVTWACENKAFQHVAKMFTKVHRSGERWILDELGLPLAKLRMYAHD